MPTSSRPNCSLLPPQEATNPCTVSLDLPILDLSCKGKQTTCGKMLSSLKHVQRVSDPGSSFPPARVPSHADATWGSSTVFLGSALRNNVAMDIRVLSLSGRLPGSPPAA